MFRFVPCVLLCLAAAPAFAAPADDRLADGLKALAAKDIVKAMDAFTKALESDPRHAMAAYERGKLLLVIGEPQNAIADFTAAVVTDPSFGRAYAGRARAKLELRDNAGAARDFDQAIAAAPKDFEVHLSRATFRFLLRDIAGAKADLTNAKAVADEATAQKIDAMLKKLP